MRRTHSQMVKVKNNIVITKDVSNMYIENMFNSQVSSTKIKVRTELSLFTLIKHPNKIKMGALDDREAS